MVDLAEIQAAYYMVAATGVLVAAIYYVYNVSVTQRNMKTNLETRQIQLLMDYNKELNESFSSMKNYMDMMSAEWSDFEDYIAKYSPRVDPEGCAYRLRAWRRSHFFGLMVRDGLIDIETFVEYAGDAPVSVWEKYKGVIEEYRRRFHFPSYMIGLEYLAEEINRYRVRKGWGVKTPNDMKYPSTNQ